MSQPIYCTAAPASGLSRAFLLGETLRRHLGAVDFRVLVVEHPRVARRLRRELPDQTLLALDEIDCPSWLQLAFIHPPRELVMALSPVLLRRLLREGDAVYCDADMELVGPPAEIATKLRSADAVLMENVAPGSLLTGALARIGRGRFNLGMVAVSAEPGRRGAALVDSYAAFLAEPERFADGEDGSALLDAPARWAASSLTRGEWTVATVAPPQYGLAHWNAWGARAGAATANGAGNAVVFCHHAGIQGVMSTFSRDLTGSVVPPGSPLGRLAGSYRERLAASPFRALEELPYSLGCYFDGAPIAPEHRLAFRRLSRLNRAGIASPFASRALVESLAISYDVPVAGRLAQVILSASNAVGRVSPVAHGQVVRSVRRASNAWRRLHRVLSRD